jgi:hypothetical protein
MSDPRLGPLRAEFKALTGKNPSPRLDADALAAKLETVKAEKAAAEASPGAPPAPEASPAPEAAPGAPPAAPEAAEAPAAAPAPAAPAAKAKRGKAAEAAAEAPLGCVYLRHPEGIGASYAGVELVPDDDGRLLAPAEAAGELAAHGFEAL